MIFPATTTLMYHSHLIVGCFIDGVNVIAAVVIHVLNNYNRAIIQREKLAINYM